RFLLGPGMQRRERESESTGEPRGAPGRPTADLSEATVAGGRLAHDTSWCRCGPAPGGQRGATPTRGAGSGVGTGTGDGSGVGTRAAAGKAAKPCRASESRLEARTPPAETVYSRLPITS